MEVSEFLKIFLNNERGVEIRDVVAGWPRKQYAMLAERTADIDFGCDFGPHGCAAHHYDSPKEAVKGKCCCTGCAGALGYLKVISRSDLKDIASMYDKRDGFWRKGKGCILPRQMRSPICLTFACRGKNISPADRLLLEALREGPLENILPNRCSRSWQNYLPNMIACYIIEMKWIENGYKAISSHEMYERMDEGFTGFKYCLDYRRVGECRVKKLSGRLSRLMSNSGDGLLRHDYALPICREDQIKTCKWATCPLVHRERIKHYTFYRYLHELAYPWNKKGSFRQYIDLHIQYHKLWGTSKEVPYPKR